MRVYCVNGKQYLFPQTVAYWLMKKKDRIVEETLISAVGDGGSFILKRTVGRLTPVWKILSPRVTSQRISHRVITEDEAKAWIKEHLPADLCRECFNDWPFRKEDQND